MFQISLAAARVNANLRQLDVANKLNINVSTVANWENGKTAPDADHFQELCSIYKCPMDVIFLPKRFNLSK